MRCHYRQKDIEADLGARPTDLRRRRHVRFASAGPLRLPSASLLKTSTIVSVRNFMPLASWSAPKVHAPCLVGFAWPDLCLACHDHLAPPGQLRAKLQLLFAIEPVRLVLAQLPA